MLKTQICVTCPQCVKRKAQLGVLVKEAFLHLSKATEVVFLPTRKLKTAGFISFLCCLQQWACVITWTLLKQQRDSFHSQSYPKYISSSSDESLCSIRYSENGILLGTVILITAVAKLFANLDSLRNNLQKSDLSLCWRELVTLKDLHSVTLWLWHDQPIACCNPHQSHNCLRILRSQIVPPFTFSHICSK